MLCTEFLKCLRMQHVHLSQLHLTYALHSIFLYLVPMFFMFIPISIKILNTYQITTTFESYKILTPSFIHQLKQKMCQIHCNMISGHCTQNYLMKYLRANHSKLVTKEKAKCSCIFI